MGHLKCSSVRYRSCSDWRLTPHETGYSNVFPLAMRMSTASVYETRWNGFSATNLSLSMSPLSTNLLNISRSPSLFSRTSLMRNLTNSSARSMSPSRSQNAISGSIIQNSLAWRVVFEFSALNVGPNV